MILELIIICGAALAAIGIILEYKLITSDAAKGHRYKIMKEGMDAYEESQKEEKK